MGAQVTIRSIDLDGHSSPTSFSALATDVSGRVAPLLNEGDHYASVTRAGCGSARRPVPVQTEVFNVPVDEEVTVVLDCNDPDRTKPSVQITGGPEGVVNSSDATFTFSAADNSGVVRTGCLLDQVDLDEFALESCRSPMTYESVGGGQHTFQVVAVDPNGNLSVVATRTFFVATPNTVAPLYRARQVPQGNGSAAPNVVIERNVVRAGLNDADPDGDGWAVVGETQSANERGYLDAFEISPSGAPTVIVDYDKPPGGARCYSATADLSRVTGAKRRLVIVADPVVHPDCFPDAKSDAFPAAGPVYR